MDEYERAAFELKSIVQNTSETDYTRIADRETANEDCRSVQTIMLHVVYSGYGYANIIGEQFAKSAAPRERRQIEHAEISGEIDKMLALMNEKLNGNWKMSDEEMDQIIFKSGWGATYNLEQMLEHAIVHILRHRRQIEKFLLKFDAPKFDIG